MRTRVSRKRARWWFQQMRALVNLAHDWKPTPKVIVSEAIKEIERGLELRGRQ